MRKIYNTKQKAIVLEKIRANEGRHFSVEEIYLQLVGDGHNLGKATVYRHINELQKDGVIKKFVTEHGKSACYEYVGKNNVASYHFKCTKCNELFHIQCESLDHLQEHMLSEHGFDIDDTKMVFLGTCKGCREKNNS